ncbi:MAG: hypothetical protein Q9211_004247 [Gyalolechia sp. 1 TL-2023]
MVNDFLIQSPEDTATFAKNLVEGDGVTGVGGFSLVCGKAGQPLAVISNRTPNAEGLPWIAGRRDETVGLSNATFGDRSWPKVVNGEKLLESAIEKCVSRGDSKETFVQELMQLLSVDTLPKKKEKQGWESYVKELRKSIFIPPIGGQGTDNVGADEIAAGKSDKNVQMQNQTKSLAGMDGFYGTQKQTVVLVSQDGHVTFVERTLFDTGAEPIRGSERDRWFEFDLE